MILVDTGIIIDFLKHPSDKAAQIFLKGNCAICGVVKAELIHGAKTEKEIAGITNALNCFHYIFIEEDVWDRLGIFLNTLRKQGITVPFQDALLAVLALKTGCSIWTNDKHFELIKKIRPELELFSV